MCRSGLRSNTASVSEAFRSGRFTNAGLIPKVWIAKAVLICASASACARLPALASAPESRNPLPLAVLHPALDSIREGPGPAGVDSPAPASTEFDTGAVMAPACASSMETFDTADDDGGRRIAGRGRGGCRVRVRAARLPPGMGPHPGGTATRHVCSAKNQTAAMNPVTKSKSLSGAFPPLLSLALLAIVPARLRNLRPK